MVTQDFGNCRDANLSRETLPCSIERRLDELIQLLIARGLLHSIDLSHSEQERLKDKARLVQGIGSLFADVIEIPDAHNSVQMVNFRRASTIAAARLPPASEPAKR